MTLEIKTNNQWRNFLYRSDVPEKVLTDDFDWIDDDDFDGFIKYRDRWYHISQFMRTDNISDLSGWHGYHSEGFFCGVLIRLSSCGEQYQIATYYS